MEAGTQEAGRWSEGVFCFSLTPSGLKGSPVLIRGKQSAARELLRHGTSSVKEGNPAVCSSAEESRAEQSRHLLTGHMVLDVVLYSFITTHPTSARLLPHCSSPHTAV